MRSASTGGRFESGVGARRLRPSMRQAAHEDLRPPRTARKSGLFLIVLSGAMTVVSEDRGNAMIRPTRTIDRL